MEVMSPRPAPAWAEQYPPFLCFNFKSAPLSAEQCSNNELSMISKPICHICKHFGLNYGSGTDGGCKAFPEGMPKEAMLRHNSIIKGQKGDYTFEEVCYDELPAGTKWLWDRAEELDLNV